MCCTIISAVDILTRGIYFKCHDNKRRRDNGTKLNQNQKEKGKKTTNETKWNEIIKEITECRKRKRKRERERAGVKNKT